jgi:hypothetical protein
MIEQPIDVFISRKSQDARYAKVIYDYLTKAGLNVFEPDHTQQEIGDSEYVKVINTALETTTHFILVASSKEHMLSSWVEAEWLFFLRRKRSGKASGNFLVVLCSAMKLDQVPESLLDFQVISYNRKNFPIIFNYCKRNNQDLKTAPIQPHHFDHFIWLRRTSTVLTFLLIVAVAITTYIITRPFDGTVFLEPKSSLNLSNAYPSFNKGTLSIIVDGQEIEKEVLSNGEVHYRLLDFASKKTWVKAKYSGNYWKLEQDSLLLGEEMHANIIPDGSLSKIFGHTVDTAGNPIENVLIQIDSDTLVYSDSHGIFKITLPMPLQKKHYLLTAQKTGYQIVRENYLPLSERIDIMLPKSN